MLGIPRVLWRLLSRPASSTLHSQGLAALLHLLAKRSPAADSSPRLQPFICSCQLSGVLLLTTHKSKLERDTWQSLFVKLSLAGAK
jgi:hypothetical protein